jgi:hypothetical protein
MKSKLFRLGVFTVARLISMPPLRDARARLHATARGDQVLHGRSE